MRLDRGGVDTGETAPWQLLRALGRRRGRAGTGNSASVSRLPSSISVSPPHAQSCSAFSLKLGGEGGSNSLHSRRGERVLVWHQLDSGGIRCCGGHWQDTLLDFKRPEHVW